MPSTYHANEQDYKAIISQWDQRGQKQTRGAREGGKQKLLVVFSLLRTDQVEHYLYGVIHYKGYQPNILGNIKKQQRILIKKIIRKKLSL